ncbi:MAG: bifunctional 5,10-methylenetetrahydrofolate dehydrogenase/5,10-methenyltetrahydrofolate cyclohydrolase [Planctomycetaceae bacterium]
MTARRIDGNAIAQEIRREVKAGAEALRRARGVTPGLATVLVGSNTASALYVSMKRKACAESGIASFPNELPAAASQAEVLALVRRLGTDAAVHGILVQLPLPAGIDERAVLDAVPLAKDVDGFHPLNIGALAMKGREPEFVPCTPNGVVELLLRTKTPIDGAHAVVLGRSNIVGLPVALLLLQRNATVTVCHSRTRDLASITRQADILVAAIGRPRFVKGDMIRPGATVIDVGVNTIPDPTRTSGKRTVGDVDFEGALEVAGAITPVPGGVGPMTIAMLLANTLRSASR